MELRHILIVLSVIVIAAIVVDGIRRVRARQATPPAQVPVAKPGAAGRGDDDFNPELPSGGARVIRRDRVAPQVGSVESAAIAVQAPKAAARKIEQVDMFGDVEIPAAEPAPAREIIERGELPRRQQAARAGERPLAPARKDVAEKPKRPSPEEVIVVHVMGNDERLSGKLLMQAVLDCGMRWGEYHIFHRYEGGAQDALAMFSMANAVEPGIFDIDAMEAQSYVGVSFFLMLPGPANSRQALEMMVEAARRVARDTGGELRDEHHSALTQQTIEHLRQRVMEYERRRLAQQRVNG
ncbi:MAG: cell division protein ZipA [Gammaproteobacteria bacterium]